MIEKVLRRYFIEPRQRRMNKIIAREAGHMLRQHEPLSNHEAKELALRWLLVAQSNSSNEGSGFDRAFTLTDLRWELPYPETTGYIIPTLLNCIVNHSNIALNQAAHDAGEWLAFTQFENGAICSKQWTGSNVLPSVFNTGMGLHGFLALLAKDGNQKFAECAIKAGNWIVSTMDTEGSWTEYSYNGLPHSYYTMVSWSLVLLSQLVNDSKYMDAAIKNLKWTQRNQECNGWVKYNSFNEEAEAITHTISYCAQGLVESGTLLNDASFIKSAESLISPLNEAFEKFGFLPGAFDSNWTPKEMNHKGFFNQTVNSGHWECITGTAQASCTNWALFKATKKEQYRLAGIKMNRHLKRRQLISTNENINGGLTGSWPIYGPYDTLCIPNHAAKFFIDCLSLEDEHEGIG